MTWTAGQKADATKVNALIRESYTSPAKRAIREWVTQELIASGVSLALDFHGGGQSAEEMTRAGLAVLSIDDGRQVMKEHGVSAVRAKRALAVFGDAGGYLTAWGTAERHAASCDGAFLDFMGPFSREVERTLLACSHMRCVAITLMPERVPGFDHASPETWEAAYRAAVEFHTGLRVSLVRRYRRPKGHWVFVLMALQRGLRHGGQGGTPSHPIPGHIKGLLAYKQRRSALQDPAVRAKQNETQRRWRAAHPERWAELQKLHSDRVKANPERLAARRDQQRLWRAANHDRLVAYDARRRPHVSRAVCCASCGKEFTQHRKNNIYCSKTCCHRGYVVANRDRVAATSKAWRQSDKGQAWLRDYYHRRYKADRGEGLA